MNYSINYFGKNLEELEYDDITIFFAEEKEESDKIEFKSFSIEHGNVRINLEGVIRGICAFLNSEGGIIIWGAPIGQLVKGKKEKIFVGKLAPLNEVIEKDALISKISDSITPLPIGIKAKLLSNKEEHVYIFEIQKSQYSPHQLKNTYYARLDGQTKPAPHYLIEALFKKISFPNIECYIKFDQFQIVENAYALDISIFVFNFSELQNEEDVSFRLMSPQGIFLRWQNPSSMHMYGFNGHLLIYKEQIKILHFGAPCVHQDRIIVSPHELLKNHNRLELHLSFGGRKSPLKFCDYILDFTNPDLSSTADLNKLIIEKSENVLSSKSQSVSTKTKEERLKLILNR